MCSTNKSSTGPGGPNPPPGSAVRLAFEPVPRTVGMGDTIPAIRVDELDNAGHVVTAVGDTITIALAAGWTFTPGA